MNFDFVRLHSADMRYRLNTIAKLLQKEYTN